MVLDGAYQFGYEVGPNGQFHHETRGPDGVTYGCYGYIDPNGLLRVTHYVADTHGYRVVEPNHPVEIFMDAPSQYSNAITDEDPKVRHRGQVVPWKDLYLPRGCGMYPGGLRPDGPPLQQVRRRTDPDRDRAAGSSRVREVRAKDKDKAVTGRIKVKAKIKGKGRAKVKVETGRIKVLEDRTKIRGKVKPKDKDKVETGRIKDPAVKIKARGKEATGRIKVKVRIKGKGKIKDKVKEETGRIKVKVRIKGKGKPKDKVKEETGRIKDLEVRTKGRVKVEAGRIRDLEIRTMGRAREEMVKLKGRTKDNHRDLDTSTEDNIKVPIKAQLVLVDTKANTRAVTKALLVNMVGNIRAVMKDL
ncbi:conserved hypothetical protein [Culex quinquefasciatus]|uniref:Uncharacterized protein n=1 Tax=Culex quinquefasciatus TaxID=7176 RepID=B0WYI6_CULQU|nr:conserved hypothetical protein [Culex quinquefasciatus]|eukprot:XP_001862458.1 conserved hypothetical protein [Culex quinquefasciatus]